MEMEMETARPENVMHWVEGGTSPARLAEGLIKRKENRHDTAVSIPAAPDLSDLRTFASELRVEQSLRRMEHGVHVMLGADGAAKRKFLAVHPAISRLVFLNHKNQLKSLALDKITKVDKKPRIADRKAKITSYLTRFPDYLGLTVSGASSSLVVVFRGPREMADFIDVLVLLQQYYNLKPATLPKK